MSDPSGRYTLVYNGEIYNYRALADDLRTAGVALKSSTDTEVVLYHLMAHGWQGLADFNGFFSLALYDSVRDELLLARDRFGIKPLYYAESRCALSFASEMKALSPLLASSTIDRRAAYFYFLLNYIPGEETIYEEVHRLAPGHCLRYSGTGSTLGEGMSPRIDRFSPTLPEPVVDGENASVMTYDDAQSELRRILDRSVEDRLVADVPLGCFLSGGVDSSVIASIASKKKTGLKTFSIGFKDNAFFDESPYSQEVADHLGTDHQVFHLTNEEMLEQVMAVLEYTDEPFADSSSIAVHALSKMSRSQVTVALSGDGADELFGGYNKHAAHLRAAQKGMLDRLVSSAGPIIGRLPASRDSYLGNKSRQLSRYGRGAKMSPADRYWHWASFTDAHEVESLLCAPPVSSEIKSLQARYHNDREGLASVLRADVEMLLPGDMLTKVDRMSMANSLEVRVPFLDHRLVDFAMALPIDYRIRSRERKRILKDAYRRDLPASVFDRSKKGFEVPLKSWFDGPLRSLVIDSLDPDRHRALGILSPDYIAGLRSRFMSGRYESEVHLIWALVVWGKTVG